MSSAFPIRSAQRTIWPALTIDDSELRLDPDDTVESIRPFYQAIIADNRVILDEVSDLDSRSPGGVNRRWVLLHLIEELARHAGLADLLRGAIDGSRGG